MNVHLHSIFIPFILTYLCCDKVTYICIHRLIPHNYKTKFIIISLRLIRTIYVVAFQ